MHGVLVHVDMYGATPVLLQFAKDLKPGEDRFFPLPQLARLDFVAFDHAFDLF
ncbi:hypothetical protein D3C72_2202060 [compost metagenome]